MGMSNPNYVVACLVDWVVNVVRGRIYLGFLVDVSVEVAHLSIRVYENQVIDRCPLEAVGISV